jgi:tetratricopeptide (TPR) repeat protein
MTFGGIMKISSAFWIYTCVLSALLSCNTFALNDTEQLAKFADHLYKKGDYFRAVTEYERLKFLFPNAEQVTSGNAEYMIAMCYLNGKKYDIAEKKFHEIIQLFPESGAAGNAARFLIALYLETNSPDKAIRALRRHKDVLLLSDREFALFSSYCNFALHRKDQALSPLEPSEQPYWENKFAQIPKASPILAGSLSAILPGAGQLYVGRKSDALIAFIINAALIGGAYAAFENDEEVLGGVFVFFETSWYAGTIYNAVNSAHKRKRNGTRKFLERFNLELGVLPDSKDCSIQTTLNVNF